MVLIFCIPLSVNVVIITCFLRSPKNGTLFWIDRKGKAKACISSTCILVPTFYAILLVWFLLLLLWSFLFFNFCWFGVFVFRFSSYCFWYFITNLNQNLFLSFFSMFCIIQFIMHLRELVLKISDLSLVLFLFHLHLKKPHQEKSDRIFFNL